MVAQALTCLRQRPPRGHGFAHERGIVPQPDSTAGGNRCRDFRHVRDWIFDLDNTLYRADNGIFAQIEARMTDYVDGLLGLPRDAARAGAERSLSRSWHHPERADARA